MTNVKKAMEISSRFSDDTLREIAYKVALEAMRRKDEQIKAIAETIADIFGSPFEYSPLDEDLLENEVCENCCNGSDCTDALCWMKYFELKYKNKMTNNDRQERCTDIKVHNETE